MSCHRARMGMVGKIKEIPRCETHCMNYGTLMCELDGCIALGYEKHGCEVCPVYVLIHEKNPAQLVGFGRAKDCTTDLRHRVGGLDQLGARPASARGGWGEHDG